MQLTKTAAETLMKKIAAVDATDQANAIDLGFARGCHAMGLNQLQTQKLAKIAKAKLAKFAKENGIDDGEHDAKTPAGK